MPAKPQPFYPQTGVDVSMYDSGATQINTSFTGKLITPNTLADHGPNCEAPAADNALPSAANTHSTTSFADSVYVCHDHVMTSLNDTGYAQATLMPDAVANWSDGQTTTIQWRVSTFTSSDRDWWDMVLTPFSQQLELPASDQGGKLSGTPKNAVFFQLCGLGSQGKQGQHGICANVITNGHSVSIPTTGRAQESVLTPSRSTRTLYQVQISSNHIKVTLPEHNLTFIDANVSIPFTSGVMQLAHEAYDEQKTDACGPPADQKAIGSNKCEPNTWHWSDISISNAQHFDLSHPANRFMNASHATNTFMAPAKAGSYLRFLWFGANMQVSFDGGKTWTAANHQPSEFAQNQYGLNQSLIAVPAGATGFTIKSNNDGYGSAWLAHDFALLGPVGSGSNTPPANTPTPSSASPTPMDIKDAPCMLVTSDGKMINGHCTGTFTPDQ